jgi:hypothetical protein
MVDEPELSGLEQAIGVLRRAVIGLEPQYLSTEQAQRLVRLFSEGERVCAAGKTVAARRVERSKAWREQGHRSAAHWMAHETGVSVGQAVGTLQTARRLEYLPATAMAFASGELSEAKVKEVAGAAAVDPDSEKELLNEARTATVVSLRDRCQKVKAQANDEIERHERIHRNRYLRKWTDSEGAMRFEGRMTPQEGATVLAGMEPHRVRITREAKAQGRAERSEAYAADALVAMARASGGSGRTGPSAMVHVRVDHSALVRGHAQEAETSEIPGIGPIPVAAARMLASDSILKVLLTKGAEVMTVANAGRTIPAAIRTGLEERDPTCVVPGCDVREGLEIDHIQPLAEGGLTTMANTARLCRWHHHCKTFLGYQLSGEPGTWTWTGPDPPPD